MPAPSTVTRIRLWLPPLIYMAVIFYFSSQSDPVQEVTARVSDKLLHLVTYSGLAVLFCRALVRQDMDALASLVLATLLASAYGASDEYHQSFVPGRNAEVADWIVDTLGAALGAFGYLKGSRLRTGLITCQNAAQDFSPARRPPDLQD